MPSSLHFERIRPLKVCFSTSDHVKLLFKNVKFFENKNLEIASDSSPCERLYLQQLHDELNARLDCGETDLTSKFVNNKPQKTSKRKIF